ncbi:polyphosphate kinase 1 [Alcaligenes endophyticus]|uniref:Polyphosphate kinase n=1 Tax=Alcaligenes endophyticus TaxID=1929088 RepID=A0ABT8EN11_9BURK|nr:polyphosphate kinase 1 [Alcaligenes endophyticus]MCX5591481.1 polyphosphate kinase 1 [Alcaligenes endophyticus]MDN4122638.1 polyphosphate kinase 1 [Alcaligenes endophyticus]
MLSSPDTTLLNRELSLLKFNERVMAMAENPSTPLLERLRYLCIVSSNLDEFFEIRISSIKEQVLQNPHKIGEDGFLPIEAFNRVQEAAHALVDKQNNLLMQQVLPSLMEEGIGLLFAAQWTESQREWAYQTFMRDVMPLLTPVGLDPAHPFPRVYNKSLNYIIELSGNDAFGRTGNIAIVQAPRALPRLIRVPDEISHISQGYMLLTSLISVFVNELFPGMDVKGCYQWRVTRNSDLFVDEEEVTNLRLALQGELSQRNFGAAVRLEIDQSMPEELEFFLQKEFQLAAWDTYRVRGPVNLSRLMQLCNVPERPDLQFPEYRAPIPAPFDAAFDHPSQLFAAIAKRDQLFHHPYQSFQPVLSFLRAAAVDPDVVAIKQTIYRTGEDSELMNLLLSAARAGKEVTVVVELMARFDEQTNINWAAKMEEVGAHVSYGVVGNKTHAKMLLVLRRENGEIRRYGHVGTGNYHPRTARLYTDFGLITANRDICDDMDKVFSLLTGLGAWRPLKVLLQSPFTLHDTMIAKIKAEEERAREGKRARIMAKMNSLLEPKVIEALYSASQAGVRVDLIVRGACALRPGVPGLSEKIQVRSLVGRFLEHSRIFYFYNEGQEDVYMSSADWMDRNFFRRVELAVPVLDRTLKRRVISEAFTFALKDNQLAWKGNADGTYSRIRTRRAPFNLHNYLMERLG